MDDVNKPQEKGPQRPKAPIRSWTDAQIDVLAEVDADDVSDSLEGRTPAMTLLLLAETLEGEPLNGE